MPLEIEAKFQVDDLAAIEQRLIEADGSRFHDLHQKDLIFDRPDRTLRRTDSNLRIRLEQCGDMTEITICYKGRLQSAELKKREEIELKVADYEVSRLLLEALGFEVVMELDKHRRMAKLNDCLVCLDRITDLGTYVEIEGPSEEKIYQVIEMLGLKGYPSITSGYPSLLAQKRSRSE